MADQDTNEITLKTYKHKVQEYIDHTPQKINDAEYPWIDEALKLIPASGTILEIGSGAGRNAKYIIEQGYKLECTEAVLEFVEVMQQKGLNARYLNILSDEISKKYDMVFANAVLVHFTPLQSRQVFGKVHRALKQKGVFALSLKMGDGETWTEEKLGAPRYFCYWQHDAIKELAEETGFEWMSVNSGETSLKNGTWLYIILRKI